MKIKQQLTRKYYKYITVESSWTQPVLLSNGTIGVDDFAVTASYNTDKAYNACNSTGWRGNGNPTFTFFIKNPICVKQLKFSGIGGSLNAYIKQFILSGSNDGNNWINIQTFNNNTANNTTFIVNNNNFYSYYKISVKSSSARAAIVSLSIIATQQATSIVESTKVDYDFYKDEIALNAFVDNNVYKAKKF